MGSQLGGTVSIDTTEGQAIKDALVNQAKGIIQDKKDAKAKAEADAQAAEEAEMLRKEAEKRNERDVFVFLQDVQQCREALRVLLARPALACGYAPAGARVPVITRRARAPQDNLAVARDAVSPVDAGAQCIPPRQSR